AGIRLPDVAVPLATFTGWNAYKPPYPAGELADRDGSCLAFASDEGVRQATGDPRPSIARRYRDRDDYVRRVRAAAQALVDERLMLPDDAEACIERARRDPRLGG
ncbi:MAG TPA: alpha/beta hydrolase domain-containing protein, partial [Burkholderiaceae bacterium]|nr:alpha/beta hydrolase domain-containing protein [Burkholderiaceae bacterium]